MKKEYMMFGAAAVAIVLVAAGVMLFSGGTESAKIEKTGTVLNEGALLGLAVPAYTIEELEISGISDLEEHAAAFDGKIIGIDAGAGIMGMAQNSLSEYGLNSFTLMASSEAAMLAALKSAYEGGQHVVVTLWDPHWVAGVYDMVYLNDPEKVFGEAESIESWSRPGLAAEDPVLAQIMGAYSYDIDEFNGLLAFIQDSDDDIGVATAEWLGENPEILERWLDGVVYEEGRGDVTVGLVSWACAMGSSNVLKHVLEGVGYSVTLNTAEAGVMYTGLANGDIDLTTTAWVPLTHAQYMERYA
ncbi:MAG: glycine betaine ABC transporter substrate-binding protein [Candidatus Methanomethylophilaceae archaeon]|jgi:glycine betaine/proline transport system substrate-binding protein|nr:glycine betaine ABC transporter substrate-binding protein [Candidatus Methanomethylophilaceae archaeon]NLF33291.1 glycine/betaine ABC transporter [Thermoplasmatales archaeon]